MRLGRVLSRKMAFQVLALLLMNARRGLGRPGGAWIRPPLPTEAQRRWILPSCKASSMPALSSLSGTCRQYRLTPRCEAPRSPVQIPQDRIEFSYSRSSGPGGQNVNKLNTRVELRFNVESADWIPETMRERFSVQQRHRINKVGEIVISSQEHRTQLKNREDCLGKLEEALAQAAIVPKKRNMRTGLTEWEKENRLREKKKRSDTKAMRRQKGKGDDF